MADDDSAFNIQSHPDVLQAKREKRELKRQVLLCLTVACKARPCQHPLLLLNRPTDSANAEPLVLLPDFMT